ncbi:hypothetical protein ACJX0J_023908, partial [Zea mays]
DIQEYHPEDDLELKVALDVIDVDGINCVCIFYMYFVSRTMILIGEWYEDIVVGQGGFLQNIELLALDD